MYSLLRITGATTPSRLSGDLGMLAVLKVVGRALDAAARDLATGAEERTRSEAEAARAAIAVSDEAGHG